MLYSPGAVESRDGITILFGMGKKLQEVVASDNAGRYNVVKGCHL